MDRRTYLGAIGGLSAVGLAGCNGLLTGTDGQSGDYDVGMTARAFRPERIEVAVGDTVVWKNTSSHAHTVTAYESGIPDEAEFFASGEFEGEQAARDGWIGQTNGALYEGDTYEHTFEVAGEYQYFCVPHEQSGMAGVVVVTDGTAATEETATASE